MNIKACLISVVTALSLVQPIGADSPSRITAAGSSAVTRAAAAGGEKLAALTAVLHEYDSYVIGSEQAAAYRSEALEAGVDGTFCNLAHPGADLAFDLELSSYLLEHDRVKNLFLVIGLDDVFGGGKDAIPNCSCFGQILRCEGDAISSCGNFARSLRNITPVDAYAAESAERENWTRAAADLAVSYVEELRRRCDAAGTNLTVVLAPAAQAYTDRFPESVLDHFYSRLSRVTDYWNFNISPVSYDSRYFCEDTLARDDVADMVLARMYDLDSIYYPQAFGTFCPKWTFSSADTLKGLSRQKLDVSYTTNVPILLYHHLALTGEESDTMIYPETFARQMQLLADHGYTPVSIEALIAYVEQGSALPEKPVVITFDDGYQSNYEYAFPILKQYGFPAAIFVVGSSIGSTDNYKDTQYPITPHFSGAVGAEMVESGLISIHSHTYDMHQWAPFETGDRVRENVLPLLGESVADYACALAADVAAQDAAFAANGWEKSRVLAYPGGRYEAVSSAVLRACGYQVTMTTEPNRVNTLVQGLPQSLINLGRMNISGDTTDAQLLAYLAGCGN